MARLAGLPRDVIERARQILRDLEGVDVGTGPHVGRRGHLPESADRAQLSLFQTSESPVLERLRSLAPEQMTPIEALGILAELKRQLEDD